MEHTDKQPEQLNPELGGRRETPGARAWFRTKLAQSIARVSAIGKRDLPSKRELTRKLIWIVLIVTLLVLGFLAWYLLKDDQNSLEHRLGFELARFLIQLVLLVLFGGIIMQEYNGRRDRKNALNEFRKTFLRRLVQVYLKTKHARLLLRAKMVGNVDVRREERLLAWEPYEQQMTCIGDAKTEVEFLKRELEFFPGVFSSEHRKPLKNYLDEAEDYLKALLKEYRDTAATARDKEGRLRVAELQHLSSFARATVHGSCFRRDFAENMYQAAKIIQEERLTI